jgi:hypothetical protein
LPTDAPGESSVAAGAQRARRCRATGSIQIYRVSVNSVSGRRQKAVSV